MLVGLLVLGAAIIIPLFTGGGGGGLGGLGGIISQITGGGPSGQGSTPGTGPVPPGTIPFAGPSILWNAGAQWGNVISNLYTGQGSLLANFFGGLIPFNPLPTIAFWAPLFGGQNTGGSPFGQSVGPPQANVIAGGVISQNILPNGAYGPSPGGTPIPGTINNNTDLQYVVSGRIR